MMLLVRKERLELSRLAALEPKSSASTNSATFACGAEKPQGARIITERPSTASDLHHGAAAGLTVQHPREHLRQARERHRIRKLCQLVRL